ncbi:helix-turn-helix transcriptional regulator [Escherichia coli]|nr:helix-turn-helix transcriptional regulator [Escherichia coli]EKY5908422.1 helix-turn-helix transcriptional regulator [Escherichia coli]EKY5937003.1 helix-turn-helix transcriptional regulator [Escherichia coli]EKY5999905.1 helix-turn-helix transcriptional regulator [Escherichia coli]EKY6078635.1 helix-turn-helix transcriptional regulator [Escherichia coli]
MLKEMTINAILNYIEDNIETSKIDIDTLVEFSGYSRRYLQLIFRHNIGMPVGQYIQRRRISRAALFLRLTNFTIVSISERLFYDSQQTFNREFKKNTGFTPLQYRKNKLWTFKHQTGPRNIKSKLSAPELRYLPEYVFYGTPVLSKCKIPYSATSTKQKWNIVKSQLSQKKNCIISNDIIQGSIPDNEFFINSIIWETDKNSETKTSIAHGVYAHFTYKGQIDDYVCYINDIYLNALPFYNLQRKNILDLEVISRATGDDFYFEYFLPVENKDIHANPVHYTPPFFIPNRWTPFDKNLPPKNTLQKTK